MHNLKVTSGPWEWIHWQSLRELPAFLPSGILHYNSWPCTPFFCLVFFIVSSCRPDFAQQAIWGGIRSLFCSFQISRSNQRNGTCQDLGVFEQLLCGGFKECASLKHRRRWLFRFISGLAAKKSISKNWRQVDKKKFCPRGRARVISCACEAGIQEGLVRDRGSWPRWFVAASVLLPCSSDRMLGRPVPLQNTEKWSMSFSSAVTMKSKPGCQSDPSPGVGHGLVCKWQENDFFNNKLAFFL